MTPMKSYSVVTNIHIMVSGVKLLHVATMDLAPADQIVFYVRRLVYSAVHTVKHGSYLMLHWNGPSKVLFVVSVTSHLTL